MKPWKVKPRVHLREDPTFGWLCYMQVGAPRDAQHPHNELREVALGGGPTRDIAIANAIEFSACLQFAIRQL